MTWPGVLLAACLLHPAAAAAQAAGQGPERPWLPFAGADRSLIVVAATLDGEPVRALVDTGYVGVAIDRSYAVRHHLPLTGIGTAYSVGGVHDVYRTPRASLSVDGIDGRVDAMQVLDVTNLAKASDDDIQVVIGASFIARYGLEIDFDHRRLRFASEAPSAPVIQAVPLGYDGGRFIMTGTALGRAVTPLMLDTGSDADLDLGAAAAAALPPDQVAATDLAVVGAGGEEVHELATLRGFRLADVELGTVSLQVEPAGAFLDHNMMAGSVGLGILSRYNITVDAVRHRLVLASRATAQAPQEKSTVGTQGDYRSGRFVVSHVMRGSPAALAGLKPGDQICRADGAVPAPGWGVVAPGHRYALTLCDGRSVSLTTAAFY